MKLATADGTTKQQLICAINRTLSQLKAKSDLRNALQTLNRVLSMPSATLEAYLTKHRVQLWQKTGKTVDNLLPYLLFGALGRQAEPTDAIHIVHDQIPNMQTTADVKAHLGHLRILNGYKGKSGIRLRQHILQKYRDLSRQEAKLLNSALLRLPGLPKHLQAMTAVHLEIALSQPKQRGSITRIQKLKHTVEQIHNSMDNNNLDEFVHQPIDAPKDHESSTWSFEETIILTTKTAAVLAPHLKQFIKTAGPIIMDQATTMKLEAHQASNNPYLDVSESKRIELFFRLNAIPAELTPIIKQYLSEVHCDDQYTIIGYYHLLLAPLLKTASSEEVTTLQQHLSDAINVVLSPEDVIASLEATLAHAGSARSLHELNDHIATQRSNTIEPKGCSMPSTMEDRPGVYTSGNFAYDHLKFDHKPDYPKLIQKLFRTCAGHYYLSNKLFTPESMLAFFEREKFGSLQLIELFADRMIDYCENLRRSGLTMPLIQTTLEVRISSGQFVCMRGHSKIVANYEAQRKAGLFKKSADPVPPHSTTEATTAPEHRTASAC